MVDDVVIANAGQREMTVAVVLTTAKGLCDQQLTFEADALLTLTLERFTDVRNQLQGHGNTVFEKALAKFWNKLQPHSTSTLAGRVVGSKYLIQDLEALHSGADGLDKVCRGLRGGSDAWTERDAFEAAKNEYETRLRAAIATTVRAWKANIVTHKTVIEEADRLFKLAIDSRDAKKWRDNELAMTMGKAIRELAEETLTHVLSNQKPGWFIPNVEREGKIAEGSFGIVYKGKWSAHGDTGGADVVVKQLKPGSDGVITIEMTKQFVKEVDLWVQLMHPYVLRLFGANHTDLLPYMVCEYAKNGNLRDYLTTPEGKKRFWRMLYHVSLGIGYLHGKNIIHGDLKLDNFVLGNDNYARVTDFSLTRVKLSSDVHMTVPVSGVQAAGALPWRAPECVGVDNVAPQLPSDVYSFGMCIFEAFAGIPYTYLPDQDSVIAQIKQANLPSPPKGITIPEDAMALIQKITRKDPRERPTIQEVSRELWKFADEEEKRENEGKAESTNNVKLVCEECNTDLSLTSDKKCPNGHTGIKSQFKIESKADLPRVMELLSSQAKDQKLNAMQALQSYICHDLVQQKEVFDACAIAILAQIVNDTVEEPGIQRDAMVTLACVVIGNEPAQFLMKNEKSVSRLVQILRSGPDPLKSKAANSLGYVSYRNEEIYKVVTDEANLLQLVADLPAQSAEARRDKHRALKMLQEQETQKKDVAAAA